jgi:hypothetical protein
MAAVTAITHPTRHNAEVFVALAQQRAQGRAYRSLTDEPDVAALAARLALSAHSAARPGRDSRRRGSFRRVPSGAGGVTLGKPHAEALATTGSQLTSASPQRHLSAPGQPCTHAAKS